MEKLIEELKELSYRKYKKLSCGCTEHTLLTKKIPVEINGVVFCGWNEYVSYKVCEYIKDKIPECNLELFLNGNDTIISLAVNENEKNILYSKIKCLIEEWKE